MFAQTSLARLALAWQRHRLLVTDARQQYVCSYHLEIGSHRFSLYDPFVCSSLQLCLERLWAILDALHLCMSPSRPCPAVQCTAAPGCIWSSWTTRWVGTRRWIGSLASYRTHGRLQSVCLEEGVLFEGHCPGRADRLRCFGGVAIGRPWASCMHEVELWTSGQGACRANIVGAWCHGGPAQEGIARIMSYDGKAQVPAVLETCIGRSRSCAILANKRYPHARCCEEVVNMRRSSPPSNLMSEVMPAWPEANETEAPLSGWVIHSRTPIRL